MENYFWNTEETQSVKKLYVLIIYDIVDNKNTGNSKNKEKYYLRIFDILPIMKYTIS